MTDVLSIPAENTQTFEMYIAIIMPPRDIASDKVDSAIKGVADVNVRGAELKELGRAVGDR